MAMEWRIEYSEAQGGPYEPLVVLSADSWHGAESELVEETAGTLFLGYYRVSCREAAAAALYVWDGVTGGFRRMA
jgi:hypothetical protein